MIMTFACLIDNKLKPDQISLRCVYSICAQLVMEMLFLTDVLHNNENLFMQD